MSATAQYLDLYQQIRQQLDAAAPARVNALREEARQALAAKGFPTRRDERYRYTDVVEAFRPDYGFQVGRDAARNDVPDLYGTLADPSADAVVALNTMFAQHVEVVNIPPGVTNGNILTIRHFSDAKAPLMQVRRLVIVVGEGAQLRLLLDEKADSEQEILTTQVTELFLRPGAQVEFYDFEETHATSRRFHHLFASVGAGARLTHVAATLTSGLTRNQTDVRLVGEGASATLLGVAIADARQHVENNTVIAHEAPSCTSDQLYKYVVDDNATAAFAGRILVRPDAQHTVSHERNANLVCASTARMWTQPMLEIYADDVECAHGATVGQLNDDALFYMMQRGIEALQARMLLKQAFAADVISEIPQEAIRQRLAHLVDRRLQGELRNCRDCSLCK